MQDLVQEDALALPCISMMYLDYAATTPIDPRVTDVMIACMKDYWANPSSPHAGGRNAKAAMESARETMAMLLKVKPHEIVFVASGSEANTLALLGIAERYERKYGKPGHMILSSIEHTCSMRGTEKLAEKGWRITALPVDETGLINPDALSVALKDDTALVSVQWANSEVGTVQSIEEIAEICKQAHVPFHTDAVQAIAQLPLPHLPDLTSIAAHKFYGPKGIGALIIREDTEISGQVLGGGQEWDLRAGTENVPGIVGMAKALELAIHDQPKEAARLTTLRDSAIEQLEKLPGISLTGHRTKRLPGSISIHTAGKSGEALLMQLDMKGICVSTGSACATGAAEPSHVLRAMGIDDTSCKQHLRITMGRWTTNPDIESFIAALSEILKTK